MPGLGATVSTYENIEALFRGDESKAETLLVEAEDGGGDGDVLFALGLSTLTDAT